jgi:hypothetical protein
LPVNSNGLSGNEGSLGFSDGGTHAHGFFVVVFVEIDVVEVLTVEDCVVDVLSFDEDEVVDEG